MKELGIEMREKSFTLYTKKRQKYFLFMLNFVIDG